MWSSRSRQGRRRTDRRHRVEHPPLTNVVSRAHGLSFELPRELARSRRHGHAFSLILLRDADRGPRPDHEPALGDVIDRLALRLRLSDLLVRLDDERVLVTCPETDAAGARVLMSELIGLAGAEGVSVRAGLATFPTSALTASELLRACERDVEPTVVPGTGAAPWRDELHAMAHEAAHR